MHEIRNPHFPDARKIRLRLMCVSPFVHDTHFGAARTCHFGYSTSYSAKGGGNNYLP